jgi:hypothetical protein
MLDDHRTQPRTFGSLGLQPDYQLWKYKPVTRRLPTTGPAHFLGESLR